MARIKNASTDSDRAAAAAFLQTMIGNDQITQIRPAALEGESDRPSLVLQASDRRGLAGALHIGRPYDDADWFNAHGGDPAGSAFLVDHAHMLHSIAVRPDQRRTGLGGKLLRRAERRAAADGALIVFGVAGGPIQTDPFYTRHGYAVGPAATPLAIQFGDRMTVFPLENTPARWFFKILPAPSDFRRASRRAPRIFAQAAFIDPAQLEQWRTSPRTRFE